MEVQGLVWVGTRTSDFTETVRFFETVLELPVGNSRPHFTRLDLPDAGCVEVFDSAEIHYSHFSSGPVPGFQVGDFDRARKELERNGHELLLPEGGDPGDYRWQHFRGPDGCVYEIVDYPHRPSPKPPAGSLGITNLVWMGTSTPDFEDTARFFKDTMKLRVVEEGPNLIECALPDGSAVEALRRGSPMDHPEFRTGPILGFGVTNIDAALQTLRDRAVPILRTRREDWGGWAHFRAPDGCVYEIKGFDRPRPQSAGEGRERDSIR
jgi:catechol 2,3-dioxygenase-like lactoylglutathione lyase family enzyme